MTNNTLFISLRNVQLIFFYFAPDYKVLYRTGDFARVVGDKLFYEGRTDSQVKVRGHRVDLSEIEAALQKLEEVDKVYILVYKPGEFNQVRKVAFILSAINSYICANCVGIT